MGFRPIRPESGQFDLVMAGACDQHFYGIREYLSEFAPATSCDPRLIVEEGRRVRSEANMPNARLALLARSS